VERMSTACYNEPVEHEAFVSFICRGCGKVITRHGFDAPESGLCLVCEVPREVEGKDAG
jgi:hypothetical protein